MIIYRCEYCDKPFDRKLNLVRHYNRKNKCYDINKVKVMKLKNENGIIEVINELNDFVEIENDNEAINATQNITQNEERVENETQNETQKEEHIQNETQNETQKEEHDNNTTQNETQIENYDDKHAENETQNKLIAELKITDNQVKNEPIEELKITDNQVKNEPIEEPEKKERNSFFYRHLKQKNKTEKKEPKEIIFKEPVIEPVIEPVKEPVQEPVIETIDKLEITDKKPVVMGEFHNTLLFFNKLTNKGKSKTAKRNKLSKTEKNRFITNRFKKLNNQQIDDIQVKPKSKTIRVKQLL